MWCVSAASFSRLPMRSTVAWGLDSPVIMSLLHSEGRLLGARGGHPLDQPPAVDRLSGGRSERLLHPPGNDEKPDDPGKSEDVAGQDCQRGGCREAFGTNDPALHD